jgi:predicted double-glycine peptidase
MVLAARDFEISEFDLRTLCECDEMGARFSRGVKAVIELGFDSYVANLNIEELKELVSKNLNPIVSFRQNENVEYSHAVVIFKIAKGKIYFQDPAIGEREMEIDLFVKNWSHGQTIVVGKKIQ